MAVITWGKPKIVVKSEDGKYILLPSGVENSTELATTKGDKKEAKIEGGENEDVRFGKNTYALSVEIRDAKGRKQPIRDHDGIVDNEYEVYLQPEDPTLCGIYMQRARVSVENKFSSENGASWVYTFDALKPTDGSDQIKRGVITITEADGVISNVTFAEDTDE